VELARTVLRHAAKNAARGAAVQWSRPETRLNGTSSRRLHGASLGSVHQQRINGRSTIIDWTPLRGRRDFDGGPGDQGSPGAHAGLRDYSYFLSSIRAETVEVP
jgi:hypothetical protein